MTRKITIDYEDANGATSRAVITLPPATPTVETFLQVLTAVLREVHAALVAERERPRP
jgi:hypothetical protein